MTTVVLILCLNFMLVSGTQPVITVNTTVDEFQKLFKHKRQIQLEAVKGLLNLAKYEAKYEFVNRMFDKIFELHDKSWSLIENSDYIPGGDDALQEPVLPRDPRVLESLSLLLENCALVGDVVLRLPSIAGRLLNKNAQWMTAVKHCFSFCKNTRLLDPVTEEMFLLAAQELNFIPRNPNFTNPYRADIGGEQKRTEQKSQRKNNRKLEL